MTQKKANKTSKKIAPILQFAVLCDGVTKSDKRGKIAFIGVFDNFLRPTVIPHFALALGWKGGKGKFVHKVRFLNPELKEMLQSPEMEFVLKHETQGARNVVNFEGMNFPSPGVYWVEIILDGKNVMSIPLPVLKEEQ